MQITENDITGKSARELRKRLGLTQEQFWNPLRIEQSVGSRYEQEWNGVTIPASVKTLLIATHIAGLRLDASTDIGVSELMRLGVMQEKFNSARALAKGVIKSLEESESGIHKARAALQSI